MLIGEDDRGANSMDTLGSLKTIDDGICMHSIEDLNSFRHAVSVDNSHCNKGVTGSPVSVDTPIGARSISVPLISISLSVAQSNIHATVSCYYCSRDAPLTCLCGRPPSRSVPRAQGVHPADVPLDRAAPGAVPVAASNPGGQPADSVRGVPRPAREHRGRARNGRGAVAGAADGDGVHHLAGTYETPPNAA